MVPAWRQLAAILVLMSAFLAAMPIYANSMIEVRAGHWKDRTRLVLETEKPINVVQDALEEGREFTLEFDGIGSDALAWLLRDVLDDQPLVAYYRFSGRGLYSTLTLELAEPAQIKAFELAEKGDQPPRAVIDIFPRSKQVARLVDARSGKWPDRERLVLETDRKIKFYGASHSRGRVFEIVLEGMDPQQVENALTASLAGRTTTIQSLYAENAGSDTNRATRLRLTSKHPVTYRVFDLEADDSHQYRFVVDLMKPSQKRPSPDPAEDNSQVVSVESAKPSSVASEQNGYPRELWLDVRLNQQADKKTVLALRDQDENLLISQHDLQGLGLVAGNRAGYFHYGEPYHRLVDLGVQSEIDMSALTAELTAPAHLFSRSRLTYASSSLVPLKRSPLGGFMNYDISATHSDSNEEVAGGGFFELGAFNGWGSGTTNAVVNRNYQDESYELIRLNTTWRKDNPENMHTLVVGDTTTTGTAWSGASRFAGIQWGTNFETRPGFITMPMINIAGQAELPSTVDLYVNDVLKYRTEIPSGPFTIDDIPTISGSGDVQLVVQDILGREQVITENFYSDNSLLRKGLNEYSFEMGAAREAYGFESNQYGDLLASGTWRRGLNNWFTLEGHGQVMEDEESTNYMGGLGASWILPFGGTLSSAVAGSAEEGEQGSFASVNLNRQGQYLSFGVNSQYATEEFWRIGVTETSSRQKYRINGYIGTNLGLLGSLTLGYTEQTYWNRDEVKFGTLRYSKGFGRFGQLSISAVHFPEGNDTTVSGTYTVPLSAERTTASIGASGSESSDIQSIRLQRGLPAGEGFGYKLAAYNGDQERYEGDLSYQNNVGLLKLEGSRSGGVSSFRGGAKGGLAFMGTGVHPSRRISSSFGVVRVGGFEDVRVYASNQEVGRTNENGYAMVPRLRPYERNQIRIEQADLPLGATLSSLDQEVSPYFRSGIYIDFPVAKRRDAFFRLVSEEKEPLEVGAVVRKQNGEVFPVGHRGEVFVTDLEERSQLSATWNDRQCSFQLVVPDTDEPFVELGTVLCQSN